MSDMKRYMSMAVVLLSLLLSFSSCHKDKEQPNNSKVERKIKYVLYTNEDFSDDEHNITFSVFARDNNRNLLDSAISTMKVKEIPSAANKIVVEKTLVTDASAQLVAGFTYKIEGVGESWYLDSIPAGQNNKIIEYAFK
jgi:hypothetical protein